MKSTLALLLFLLPCISGAILSIYIGITGHGPTGVPLLSNEFTNPIQRYACPLTIFSLSAAGIAYLVLVSIGIVVIDYHDASNYMKAKSNIAWCIVLFPFVVFSSVFAVTLAHNREYYAYIISAIYLLFFVYNWLEFKRAKDRVGT